MTETINIPSKYFNTMTSRGSENKKSKKLNIPAGTINNTKGSHLWAYNHFRTGILTGLLNDLIDLEQDGLDDTLCSQLEYFANASTQVPSSGSLSGKPLYKVIESFNETYFQWNEVKILGASLEVL